MRGGPWRPCSSADRYAGETPSAAAIALSVTAFGRRSSRTRSPNGVMAESSLSVPERQRHTRAATPLWVEHYPVRLVPQARPDARSTAAAEQDVERAGAAMARMGIAEGQHARLLGWLVEDRKSVV